MAAARKGDEVNPKKESSGCQFYIVTGQVFNEEQLLDVEQRMKDARLTNIFNSLAQKHIKEIYKMRRAGDNDGLMELQNKLEEEAYKVMEKEEPVRFTPEQIQAYTTVGGAPHLDGEYTVFGEVVDGMDVIDRIQKVKTNRKDRPEENIRILKATVEE